MKKIIYFFLLILLMALSANAQESPTTISPSSLSGKQFVYYTNIGPPTNNKPSKYNKDGSISVEMSPIIVDLSAIWIKFFDGKGFKLPPANSKFFQQLTLASKIDGVAITRYSDTVIKAKCMTKVADCIAKEQLLGDEEFVLNRLVRTILGKTLVYTIYEPGQSELRAIWEMKSRDGLTVITTDRGIEPNMYIEIEDDGKGGPATFVYRIDFLLEGRPITELVQMIKNKEGIISITEKKCLEVTKAATPVTGQPSRLQSHFGEFLPDLPDIAKPFFAPQILKQITNCGK